MLIQPKQIDLVALATSLAYTADRGVEITPAKNFRLQAVLDGAATKFLWNYSLSALRATTSTGTQSDAANIGQYSAGFGLDTIASGQYAVVGGNANTASGVAATAFGSNNTSSGNHSAAFGFGTVAKAFGSVTFGDTNDSTDTPNPSVTNSLDRLFQIGKGGGFNAVTILRSGNVGIGTLTPSTTLHVVGSLRIVDGNQGATKVLTSDASGNATWQTATSLPTFAEFSIPIANNLGALIGDVNVLAYQSGMLSIANTPASMNGININSGRATIYGYFNGMILNVGSGIAGGGVYDTSKAFLLQNRGNTYVQLGSTTQVNHFMTLNAKLTINEALRINSGSPATNYVWTGTDGLGNGSWQALDLQKAYNNGNVINSADVVIDFGSDSIIAIGLNVFGGSGTDIIALGEEAAIASTGDNVIAIGLTSANSNTGSQVTALGPYAADTNSGNYVNAFGLSAGSGNVADNLNAFGENAGVNNVALNLNALGSNAGNNNSGSDVNALGENALNGNSGNHVNAFGNNAGSGNTFDYVNLFGAGANATANSQIVFSKDGTNNFIFDYSAITATRTVVLPDAGINFNTAFSGSKVIGGFTYTWQAGILVSVV